MTTTSRPETTAAAAAPAVRVGGLEAQRGIAAVLVVAFHAYQYDRSGPDAAYPYAGAWFEPLIVGLDGMVDWFLVLSAFLLTLPYARAALAGRPGTGAGRFLGRRAVRIVPLYLVAVLVVWAWRNPGLPGDWRDLVEHLTFTQVFDTRRIFYTIGPAWSLAVEVQFYVLLAVLGTLGTRWAARRSPRARLYGLVAGIALLALGSLAWCVVQALVLDVPLETYPVWFGLPAKLLVLASGMAVAVVVAARTRPLPRNRLVGAAGTALVLVAMFTHRHTGGGDATFHALSGLGFAGIVLATATSTRQPTGPRRTARALEWAGLVSYSLYLWHEPLLLGLAGLGLLPEPSRAAFPVSALVLVVTGLLVAWVSYWVVEHPASSLRVRLDGPRRRHAPLPELPR